MAQLEMTIPSKSKIVLAPARGVKADRRRRLLELLWRFRLGVLGGIFLTILTVVSIGAPWLAPYDPAIGGVLLRMKPPFWIEGADPAHLLGTDGVGRDILSRLIYGGRISLLVASVSTLVAITLGLFLGVAAGYFGRWTDAVISTAVNIMLTFPFVLMALAVISVMGSNLPNLIFVLGITGWPGYTRVARADTMRLKEMEYVQAARSVGAGTTRIILRHIVPNLFSGLVVLSSVQLGRIIIAEAFLSFLGMGVKPPTPSWGNMLGESRVYMFDQWWLPTLPGLILLVTSLAVNLLGDSLRDYLDPYTKNL
jgi:peptide/nickel transport system permease protein